jgi:hypothetical protein
VWRSIAQSSELHTAVPAVSALLDHASPGGCEAALPSLQSFRTQRCQHQHFLIMPHPRACGAALPVHSPAQPLIETPAAAHFLIIPHPRACRAALPIQSSARLLTTVPSAEHFLIMPHPRACAAASQGCSVGRPSSVKRRNAAAT